MGSARIPQSLRWAVRVAAACALLASSAFGAQHATGGEGWSGARVGRVIPALAKAPKVDGVLRDLTPALTLKPFKAPGETPPSSSFSAQLGYRQDTLFLGVEVRDDRVLAGDLLTVTLFFANAETTARGYSYRFAIDGKRAPDPEGGPPSFANKL